MDNSVVKEDSEIKINGVEIQWIKQSEHVNTPKKSELFVKYLIFFNCYCICINKNSKETLLLQQSCNKVYGYR